MISKIGAGGGGGGWGGGGGQPHRVRALFMEWGDLGWGYPRAPPFCTKPSLHVEQLLAHNINLLVQNVFDFQLLWVDTTLCTQRCQHRGSTLE